MIYQSEEKSLARWVVLSGIVIFFMLLAGMWVHLNQGPAMWDDSWYLLDSLKAYDALMSQGVGGWGQYLLHDAQMHYKAPLICALPTPVYLALGRDYHLALYLNLLFMPALLISVYAMGSYFWNGRTGLLAALIVGSMPEFYGLATWFLVEYGLATFVALAMVCLIKSDDLTRRGWVIGFGVVCGLGLMQKILFPVYVAPAAIYFLVRWCWRKPGAKAVVATIAGGLLPVLVIAGPWYVTNFRSAVDRAQFSGYSHQEADLHGTGDPFTAGAMYKYVVNIVNEGTGAPYFLAGIVVVGILLAMGWGGRGEERAEGERRRAWPILVLWGLPFVVFLFGHNKAVRFVAPMLPIFALGLAVTFDRVIARLGGRGVGIVAAIFALALFCQIQNCFQPIRGLVAVSIPRDPNPHGPRRGLWFISDRLGSARTYERAAWPLRETLNELALEPGRGEPVDVMVGWDSNHFNLNNLGLAAEQGRLPARVQSTAYFTDAEALKQAVRNCSFFLIREHGEPQNRGYNTLLDVALKEVNDRQRFEAAYSKLAFPDGGVLKIYRRVAAEAAPASAFIPAGVERTAECDVRFGADIGLSGLQITRVGEAIKIQYRWVCLGRIGRQYRCFTHVRDDSGNFVGWIDHEVLDGKPPMTSWQRGDVAWESVTSILRAPGSAAVHVDIGLYDAVNNQNLPAEIVNPSGGMGWRLMPGNVGISVDVAAVKPGPSTR